MAEKRRGAGTLRLDINEALRNVNDSKAFLEIEDARENSQLWHLTSDIARELYQRKTQTGTYKGDWDCWFEAQKRLARLLSGTEYSGLGEQDLSLSTESRALKVLNREAYYGHTRLESASMDDNWYYAIRCIVNKAMEVKAEEIAHQRDRKVGVKPLKF